MFGSKEKRFKILHEEGAVSVFRVIQDTKTGVNYLYAGISSGGGITPLLDKNGEVVVTTVED
ncbi:xylan 1,4-beta-xylosidase [Acidaminobacter sp. JC074]|uniref:DUF6440 family protein n=1 Tax=Acidaminobacter sp. JC074 TaxID=2530199 RepID=UPI001F0D90DF|nr:DUF6440 family protein [Acidaminobacter sp. JC074]MCH4887346.1 xylan 1,4-beta-xylosidase [Acidaminobacter sp. JC074]